MKGCKSPKGIKGLNGEGISRCQNVKRVFTEKWGLLGPKGFFGVFWFLLGYLGLLDPQDLWGLKESKGSQHSKASKSTLQLYVIYRHMCSRN